MFALESRFGLVHRAALMCRDWETCSRRLRRERAAARRCSMITGVRDKRDIEMESEKIAAILGAIVAAVVLIAAVAFGPIGQFGKSPKQPQKAEQPTQPAAPAPRGPVIREVPQ